MKGIAQYIDLDVTENWYLDSGDWLSHSEGKSCSMHVLMDEKLKAKTAGARW
jgi:hypothetical protein